jgi:hypothetical protein
MSFEQTPITCDLAALNQTQRNRRSELASRFHSLVREVRPAVDGFAFRLAESEIDLRDLAEFVALERRCCPFLTFRIDIGEDGSVWLSLRGREGVKEFLAAEFGIEQNPKR